VINALLSRCRTYILAKITEEEIVQFLVKNLSKIQLRYPDISFYRSEESAHEPDILELIAHLGNGDLRNTLNILETACILQASGELTREVILEAGAKPLFYDRDGEEHYNLISALHKSLRDSDGDAAIYWIGRMLAGGEDPRYIARRMMNFASEDIYDPQAIILTNSVYEICEKMGMPECELPLLNAAYYLADAPKDNRIYRAMQQMHEDIQVHGNLDVPLHLRNAPTKLMKEAGYGK
jgi:putative ATPase